MLCYVPGHSTASKYHWKIWCPCTHQVLLKLCTESSLQSLSSGILQILLECIGHLARHLWHQRKVRHSSPLRCQGCSWGKRNLSQCSASFSSASPMPTTTEFLTMLMSLNKNTCTGNKLQWIILHKACTVKPSFLSLKATLLKLYPSNFRWGCHGQ